MNQQAALKRLEALEARTREPEGVPTEYFFGVERYQAQAFGDATDVIELDALIAEVDAVRRERRYDAVDTAIFISRECFPSDNPSASGIAGMIVEAHWHHDRERFGEPHAWRHQRNRSDFEHSIAGRIARLQGTPQ